MTIYFPDVSNYQAGLKIQPATVAVIAKATEGTTYRDPAYANFKSQAASVGAVFVAYHFLHAGNAAAQAQFCYSVVGAGVPLMIDCEPTGSSNPTVADCVAFRDEFNRLGGNCRLVYFPKWYWGQLKSPSLTPLSPMGLVASGYTTYSDSNADWNAYGGVAPAIWQYTDSLPYGGMKVDFNAYKGTVDELKALLKATAPAPAPTPPAPAPAPHPNTPQWRAAHNVYTPLAQDGKFGPDTIKALQYVEGVSVDGVWGSGSQTGLRVLMGARWYWTWARVVKEMQARVGAMQDGVWGSQTTGKLQAALNAGRLY